MGVRALRARIECDRETLLHLWRTHCVFNQRLPTAIGWLFRMRRAECGTDDAQRALYREIADFIIAAPAKSNFDYLMNSVSKSKGAWAPGSAKKIKLKTEADGQQVERSAETWAGRAAALQSKGTLLYRKDDVYGDLPLSLTAVVIREAAAVIASYDGLVHDWRKEHAEWLKAKAAWEANDEHKKYLVLRPRFDAFEKNVGGKAGKRRERWHLYLTWLRENPDLAAWRGAPAVVNGLDERATIRVAKAKPWKKRSVEAEEFWKANSELKELDKLHGYYEREFVRRRKTKKNPDGFDHRPTFTMPDPMLHPRWTGFNAPQTSPEGYDGLRLPERIGALGSVKLRLLTGEKTTDDWPDAWVTVQFRADPRLAQFVQRTETQKTRKGKNKGADKTVTVFRFVDRQLRCERPAQISGAKLIFKNIKLNDDGSLRSATPYIVFACTIDDLPLTERAKAIQWSETGEVTKTGKKRKSKKLPPGLVTCAVDLGLRNLAFLTIATNENDPQSSSHSGVRVFRSRNQWLGLEEAGGAHPGRWSAGPDLAHIGSHKREIKRLRRLRGKPIRGERSHVELQEHIDYMGQDRFKKAGRAIVNFALNVDGAADKSGEPYPRADVLIVEKLAGFIPDAERERGLNRALVAWNRGQLVTRIKEVAADAGLKLFEVHPAGTSQCCSRCGALGRRYSIVHDEQSGTPCIRFGWVEKLFACPNPRCGGRAPDRPDRPFTCNADHNASVNLHRRFVLDDNAVAAFLAWKDKSKVERECELARIDQALRPPLERLHGIVHPELATPF